jgi:hypothetical protein
MIQWLSWQIYKAQNRLGTIIIIIVIYQCISSHIAIYFTKSELACETEPDGYFSILLTILFSAGQFFETIFIKYRYTENLFIGCYSIVL